MYNVDEATMAQVDDIQKQVCHLPPTARELVTPIQLRNDPHTARELVTPIQLRNDPHTARELVTPIQLRNDPHTGGQWQ